DRFGPLTHHIQLRASIIMDALNATGVGVDQARSEEKARQVREVLEASKGRLRERGFLVGEKGSTKAMQSILSELYRDSPHLPLKRTEAGKSWSTTEEDLADLAEHGPFFKDYAKYKHCEKLLSTYLTKMGPARVYPRFGFLLETGRTFCGGVNLQNLPKEDHLLKEDPEAATIRSCFVPAEGCVFIDLDYGQIELVTCG